MSDTKLDHSSASRLHELADRDRELEKLRKNPLVADLIARVKALEAENAELREQLEVLGEEPKKNGKK